MTSILLNPIFTQNKENKKNNLNSVYDSNIENSIKVIERNQALDRHSGMKPEYLKQFDELRFDNIGDPSAINDVHLTSKGKNTSLLRELDFKNGYSQFQKSDMHYDVVNGDNFTHNNMVPQTSRRDTNLNADNSFAQRRVETFTGSFDPATYTKKTEKVPLFEPVQDLTYVHGMPVMNFENRFIPSNKNNNGNLPFENNVKVRPGLGDQNAAPYAVQRVNPLSVDDLRSDINQKVTYMNKPLETAKKGEIRGSDFNITKFKLPDFREQKFEDLMPSRSQYDGPIQTGKFVDMETSRGEAVTYTQGPAVSTNTGSGPNLKMTNFNPSARQSYMNDNTHAINAVNEKLVMTNIGSYTNYASQRASTNTDRAGGATKASTGNYSVDYKDVPLTTTRELLIHGNTNGTFGQSNNNGNYIFSNDMVLPITLRQTMSHDKVTNASSQYKTNQNNFTDAAKETIRQTTSHDKVTNASSQYKNNQNNFTDSAKTTVRETTSHDKITNASSQYKNNQNNFTDAAKETIRQTTSHDKITNASSQYKNNQNNFTDSAKTTIRETNSHDRITNASSQYKNNQNNFTDSARETLRQTMSHDKVTNASSQYNTGHTEYTDKARITIKESALFHTPEINTKSYVSDVYTNLSDNAKITIRQQTENTKNVGSLKASNQDGTYYRDLVDVARPTINQTTITQTPALNANTSTLGNYALDAKDVARTTLKQTTIDKSYTGPLNNIVENKISHEASDNMTIDDRRETISTFNRPANGKADLFGPWIDKDNVQLVDALLYSYTPNPRFGFDHAVTPTMDQNDIYANSVNYSKSKPSIESSLYYINGNFINTLKDNELVNDIFHQKNY
jgi:hypothetical protein